uniref:CASP-like protein n=1 Tax=Aegilops tauschii subsp. strangulata TaxID=200361 RepID=A0A453M2F2_AEGTS
MLACSQNTFTSHCFYLTTILTYCFCSHPLGEFPGNGRDGRGEGGQPRLAHRGAGAVGGRRRRDGQRRLLQQRSGVSFVKNIVRVPTLMIYPCESCARSYFVVGSVISAVCSALALYLFVVHGGGGSIAVSLLDAAAQALLFSASGAALAARGCFAGGAGAFRGRVGIAAAVGACAAAAVLVAALAGNAPSRGRGGGAAGGSGCKHGCSSPGC